MSLASRPASARHCFVGSTVRSSRSATSSSSFARVSWRSRCFGPSGRRGDERQVDLRRHRRGELDLRLLGRLVEPLKRHLVLCKVDALRLLELGDHPVDDRLVEVVAAEVVVAVRGLDLEDALTELEDRDVERPAAEVPDEDRLVGFLLEAVGERRGGRLVDDAEDVEAGDLAGVLRRLALGVVEVGGDSDDRVGHRLAEVGLGVRLELLEDHRGDLRRCVLLAARLDADVAVRAFDDLVRDDLHLLRDLVELAPHEALDREDRRLGVRHLLALGRGPDEPLAVTRERDDGRRRAAALGVRDDGGLAALQHRHAGVGRAKIDTDRLCHRVRLPPERYRRWLQKKSKRDHSKSLRGASPA